MMLALILVLIGIAGLAGHWLYRNYLRRPRRREDGMPVMLSRWADGRESVVAVHLRRRER
jgi:hypothetical protein